MFNLFLVALVTFIFSFGVQTLFYARYALGDRKIIREQKSLFAYKSGLIGDGLLIPLANVFAWVLLKQLTPWQVGLLFLVGCTLWGLLITFLFHWAQQRFRLTNWTMPQSGHWTLLGVYHAIFMFSEITFLSFVMFNYISQLLNPVANSVSRSPLFFALAILFLFFVTFVHDYWAPLFKKLLKTV